MERRNRGWQAFVAVVLAVAAMGAASCSGANSTNPGGVDGSLSGSPDSTAGAEGGALGHDGSASDACAPSCGTSASCTKPSACASGVCTDGKCAAPSPTDGIKNDSETDTDCGGSTSAMSDGAPACANGKSCKVETDCTSGSCQAGKCVPPTCTDTLQDGHETDVDCGGTDCMPCPAKDKCVLPADCLSKNCVGGVCLAATDTDGITNATETDKDCGGGFLADGTANPSSDGAPVCAVGKLCVIGSDCSQGVCAITPVSLDGGTSDAAAPDGGVTAKTCQAATATDGVKNDSETGKDCGGALLADGTTNVASDGAPACGAGQGCVLALDCVSQVCTSGLCQAPSASDHVKNDSETDTDCGGGYLVDGTANPASDGALGCSTSLNCVLGTDCLNLVCATGALTAPSPGGVPVNCPAGETCTCQKPTFVDGIDNDSETDVDCGGALESVGVTNPNSDGAPTCAVGKGCLLGLDCVQGVCNATNGAGLGPTDCPAGSTCACQAASDGDGVQNDSETDIDCGGGFVKGGAVNPKSDGAPVCATGEKCVYGTDCAEGVCNANVGAPPFATVPLDCPVGSSCTCQAAASNDKIKNDSETDVDCGGALLANGMANPASDNAPACADTLGTCTVLTASTACASGICTPAGTCAAHCLEATDCLSGFCNPLSHTCVDGASCAAPAPTKVASIMTLTGEVDADGDAVGSANAAGQGQSAGLDTCGRGESTDASGQKHESCCRSIVLPSFGTCSSTKPCASIDDVCSSKTTANGTCEARLDKYEVTAGRMRQFIESVNATLLQNGEDEYDLQAWLNAQFTIDGSGNYTASTPIGKRFADQMAATGLPMKDIAAIFPSEFYNNGESDTIVAQLGATTMDPDYPSGSQGCFANDGANGASTYWWPAVTNQKVTPVKVGGDVSGDGPRAFTQDYYDIKSMNCAPLWIYAAFCAWDGGHVATLAELDAAYGPSTYSFDKAGVTTFLPVEYTITATPAPPATATHWFQNFVPGTPHYLAADLPPGASASATGVDLTVNWNNDSYGGNYGDFYFYPNGGNLVTPHESVTSGLDYSPFIAAPGRFYLDETYIKAGDGATEGWMDLTANMLEMTTTVSSAGSGDAFCDCSSGGQATDSGLCNNGTSGPYKCSTANGDLPYPVPHLGGIAMPRYYWVGGSWEGHPNADPNTPPFSSRGGYGEPFQTQYGKAGFRCARALEP
jgi:hypothetical protein